MTPTLFNAVKAVNELGIVLLYPINNTKELNSLWYYFYPKTKMRWEWDDSGDSRVVKLWHLKESLSRKNTVVYSKWYQGRATFFSRDVFSAILFLLHKGEFVHPFLSPRAKDLMQLLLEDSPRSSKELKKQVRTEWNWKNPDYERAVKELWQKALIVGCGEVDDGAFPSLNIGATEVIHESLWEETQKKKEVDHLNVLNKFLPEGSKWRKFFDRLREQKSPVRKNKVSFEELIKRR